MSTGPAPVTASEPTTVRWGVVALSFCAVLLDGFDTASLAFVVPTLSKEWAIAPANFTYPLVLTNIGVVLGYLGCGSLAARTGRRRLLIGGIGVYAVGTLLTALLLPVQSIALLSLVRLVTGLGLGVVLPVAVSITTDHSPVRRRELVSVIVTLGLASGGTLGGFFGGKLLRMVGSDGVFWIGGLLPVVLALVMVWRLAEPAQWRTHREVRDEARVGQLFGPLLRTNTLLLWTFAFLVFIAAYTLTSWVPTLLTGYGFSPAEAPLGLAFVSLGGVLGGIVLVPLAARIGITRALILMPSLAAICMVIAAWGDLGRVALLLVLGGAGAGVTAGQIGQLTLAVALYPPGTRTTGIGWTSALGRAGSIVGPGVAGVLLALALSGKSIIALTTIPVVIAIASAAALWRRQPHTAPAGATDRSADTVTDTPTGATDRPAETDNTAL